LQQGKSSQKFLARLIHLLCIYCSLREVEALEEGGAWYARGGSKLRELYTIIHLPYTSMVLSYVLLGAAVSPSFYPNRVILTLLAYFLGLGLSAHALNELHARHWGEALSKRELEILFLMPLIGATLIGTYGMVYYMQRPAPSWPHWCS
jgi:hypothetical protein